MCMPGFSVSVTQLEPDCLVFSLHFHCQDWKYVVFLLEPWFAVSNYIIDCQMKAKQSSAHTQIVYLTNINLMEKQSIIEKKSLLYF